MNLVDHQQFASVDDEFLYKFHKGQGREIYRIGRAIKHAPVSSLEVLFQVLFDERGLSYALCAHDADYLRVPVNLVHLFADDIH